MDVLEDVSHFPVLAEVVLQKLLLNQTGFYAGDLAVGELIC